MTEAHAREILARVPLADLKSDVEIIDLADTLLPPAVFGTPHLGVTKGEIVELLIEARSRAR